MNSADYLAHLRRELAAFEACLAGDLSAPVEHCGDWTLYDLADHLGQGNLWAAVAVTEQRGDYEGPAAPRDRVALAAWFSGTSSVLLAALNTDPSASAWTIPPANRRLLAAPQVPRNAGPPVGCPARARDRRPA